MKGRTIFSPLFFSLQLTGTLLGSLVTVVGVGYFGWYLATKMGYLQKKGYWHPFNLVRGIILLLCLKIMMLSALRRMVRVNVLRVKMGGHDAPIKKKLRTKGKKPESQPETRQRNRNRKQEERIPRRKECEFVREIKRKSKITSNHV